ncbi:MAG: amidohydrolase family protein [Candidatus Izemoplasmatales bacterium]|nr:amidohydrolase family protein [bacterium]MDZ4196467.1 amidohydrolase family protein [Candidatus Izemoplasmatales bacterium]
MYDLGIINGQVWINGTFVNQCIYAVNGRIVHICDTIYPSKQFIDATNQYVIPGIIDPHVHFDLDLGNIRSRDDFYSGSVCALYGGVTTIIDFLNPSSNSLELNKHFALRKVEALRCQTDYFFHATIKEPNEPIKSFVQTVKELGLKSIKLFTTYSSTNRRTRDESIIELLEVTIDEDILVTAHIEDDSLIDLNPDFTTSLLGKSRPSISETKEAMKLASYVEKTGGKMYMVHCSSGETLSQLKHAYERILNRRFFVESCPHYFLFDETRYHNQDAYLYTMAPPLRSKKEQLLLHQGIDDVHTIGTDHCSFLKKDKQKELLEHVPLGVGGIEHSFRVMYSMFGDKVIDKMTSHVANMFGLQQKGSIEVGKDADFVLFSTHEPQRITTSHSRSDGDIYLNQWVNTTIQTTILRGYVRMHQGQFFEQVGTYGGRIVENTY